MPVEDNLQLNRQLVSFKKNPHALTKTNTDSFNRQVRTKITKKRHSIFIQQPYDEFWKGIKQFLVDLHGILISLIDNIVSWTKKNVLLLNEF